MTRRLTITLLAGAGFLLVQLGWILSISPHYGIDEFDHALRASSVAAGHWEPGDNAPPPSLGRGDLIPVRHDVAASVRTACESRPYTKVYNCEPSQDLGNGEVLIASGASRYNPTYYAVVGIIAAPFHGTLNLYALRIATALVACVLFMLTIWLAAGRARTLWPVAVIVFAALPTTVYSASIATPNGVEMITGIGVWVALLAVADRRGDPGQRRSAYLLLALFVAVLVNVHTLGILWLALIAVAVAAIHGPRTTLKALVPRSRLERVAAGISGFAVAFEVVWVLVARTNNPATERTSISGTPWGAVLNGLLLWPLQAIGAFPMRDNPAPPAVYALVLLVLGTVAVLTLRRTRLRSRAMLALAFVALASYLVPAAMTVVSFHQIGSAWQGRYSMPFSVGLLILAGRQLDASERKVPRLRAFFVVGSTAVVAAQVISQWSVMTKQRADVDLVTGTNWVPPSGLVLLSLAVAAVALWTRAFTTRPSDQHPTAPPLTDLQEVSA